MPKINIPSKNLIACIVEGKAEKAIIDMLLDHNKLIFTREQLLEEKPILTRGAVNFAEHYLGHSLDRQVSIIRILDSRSEQFKLGDIQKSYLNKIDRKHIYNVVTHPEIEILIIIHANKFQDFQKVKSQEKPSVFCKKIDKHYKKSEKYWSEYFNEIDDLVRAIQDYYKYQKISKTEYTLKDLLK